MVFHPSFHNSGMKFIDILFDKIIRTTYKIVYIIKHVHHLKKNIHFRDSVPGDIAPKEVSSSNAYAKNLKHMVPEKNS